MCGDILKTSKDAEALIKAKHGTTYVVVLHVIYLHCLFGILVVYHSCIITKQLHLYVFSSNVSEKENTYQNKCNVFKM